MIGHVYFNFKIPITDVVMVKVMQTRHRKKLFFCL